MASWKDGQSAYFLAEGGEMVGQGVKFDISSPEAVYTRVESREMTATVTDLKLSHRGGHVQTSYKNSTMNAKENLNWSANANGGASESANAFLEGATKTVIDILPAKGLIELLTNFQAKHPTHPICALQPEVLKVMPEIALRNVLIPLLPPEARNA